ncbi:MAG: hypothetical protein BZ138_07770 [Methanosphaera sp. rholeuAM270]|nr:MAG: hypothetical protein BZ138_07770 [Methanosphaera sp. rholeuAM270]
MGSGSTYPVEKCPANNKVPIRHRCVVCGYEADLRPSNVIGNAKRGRRTCDGCNHRNGTSLEDARRLFAKKNPDCIPLEGFKTQKDKVKFECVKCGHMWETRPCYLLLDGPGRAGCPKCACESCNRKTQEKFEEEVKAVNPNIKVIGKYVNSKTNIRVKHIPCGYEWEANPRGLLEKRSCPKCRENVKKSNGQRKTHEQFLAEMKEKHPDMKVLSKYISNKTKVKVKHLPCGREFEMSPGSLLAGRGCSVCNRKQRIMNSRKTHSQFIEEMQQIHPDIEVLSEYINSKSKVKVRHIPCQHEWMAAPNKLLTGRGCPKCNKLPKLTDDEYKKKLEENNIIYIPLAPVQNIDTKIPHLCPECNMTWDITPYNILFGYGCPRCRGNRQSYEEVIDDLHKSAPTLLIIDEYSGKNTRALFKCLECGHEWRATPYAVLHGAGCPKCVRKKSFPEISVYYFLDRDLEYEVLLNPRINIPHLEIKFEADVFIPELKLFVEYDGIYWHSTPRVEQRDIKREEAIYAVGYKCMHIREYNDIDEQRKSWLKEPPLLITAANHREDSEALDQCILDLETKLGIATNKPVDCLSNKVAIEEAYKNAPVYNITILENGDMEVKHNGK